MCISLPSDVEKATLSVYSSLPQEICLFSFDSSCRWCRHPPRPCRPRCRCSRCSHHLQTKENRRLHCCAYLITQRNFAGVLMALDVMFVCTARVRTQERGLMTHTQTERGRNQIRVATFTIELMLFNEDRRPWG